MKFEVELIEGGRCIIPMENQSGLIIPDDDLGATLRGIVKTNVKSVSKKARKPRGPNKPKVEPEKEG